MFLVASALILIRAPEGPFERSTLGASNFKVLTSSILHDLATLVTNVIPSSCLKLKRKA